MSDKPTLRKGDVVIVEHPAFRDMHVVAMIAEKPTTHFVQLRYFTMNNTFAEESKRRAHAAITTILPAGRDPALVAKKLRAANKALTDASNAALTAYKTAIEEAGR